MPNNKTYLSQVDTYIVRAQPFAQPILKQLRAVVHAACPQTQEVMKWGVPFFDHKGQMLCSMAAFKRHAIFGFWKAKLLPDPKNLFAANPKASMGSLGRIHSLSDLPAAAVLKQYIKAAMKLNDAGITVSGPRKTVPRPLHLPTDLKLALAKHPRAAKTFTNFSPGRKKDYVEWITEAKTSVTRQRRLATTLSWLAAGKSRNWKYEA